MIVGPTGRRVSRRRNSRRSGVPVDLPDALAAVDPRPARCPRGRRPLITQEKPHRRDDCASQHRGQTDEGSADDEGEPSVQFEVWAPQAQDRVDAATAADADARDGARSGAGRLVDRARRRPPTGRGTASRSTAAPCCPIRARAGSRTGPTGLSAVVDHDGVRLAHRRGRAGRCRARSCTSCTSAPSPARAPSTRRPTGSRHLAELGITHVELMPVCPFPGAARLGVRGGVAVGGARAVRRPRGAEALCRHGARARASASCSTWSTTTSAPSGNHLPAFGPYFTDTHHTPWGAAVNLDAPGSDEVRAYLLGSALAWLRDYRLDGLRLDAVHALRRRPRADLPGGAVRRPSTRSPRSWAGRCS